MVVKKKNGKAKLVGKRLKIGAGHWNREGRTDVGQRTVLDRLHGV